MQWRNNFMGKLSTLPNIGKVVEQQLNQVGINTIDQLTEIGSKDAWLRIKCIDDSACINRLYALQGAIEGIRWHDLSAEVKAELKEFYNNFK
jgi:DNA transformation protein